MIAVLHILSVRHLWDQQMESRGAVSRGGLQSAGPGDAILGVLDSLVVTEALGRMRFLQGKYENKEGL